MSAVLATSITAMHRVLCVFLLCLGIWTAAQADDMMLLGVGSTKMPAASGGTTTFDRVNISSNISLSGGNLIATLGAAGGPYVVARSLASHSAGQFYFEITDTNDGSSGNDVCVGIINASGSLNNFLGNDNNSAGWFGGTNGWEIGGSASGATPSYVNPNIVGVAVNFSTQMIWGRNTSAPTVWNGGGTASPLTGLGGVSFSAITGAAFAAACMNGSAGGGLVMTLNAGATPYAATAPVGFGNF